MSTFYGLIAVLSLHTTHSTEAYQGHPLDDHKFIPPLTLFGYTIEGGNSVELEPNPNLNPNPHPLRIDGSGSGCSPKYVDGSLVHHELRPSVDPMLNR